MIDLNNSQSKKGVLDALSLLISSKSRPIRIKGGENGESSSLESKLKMPKNVEIVNVEQEEKENGEEESQEEKEARIEKIKMQDSPEQIAKDLKKMQDEKNTREEKAAQKKAEEEEMARKIEKRKNAPFVAKGKIRLDFKDFEKDLEDAVMDQVKESEKYYDTFDKYNSIYANSDLLIPGSRVREEQYHPIINVYFDLSGSCWAEVDATKEKLSFLEKLKNDDVLEYETYYFASEVNKDPTKVGRGTHAFPKILKHVKDTHATNVIIVTDDDFDSQSGYIPDLPYVKVEGCVWWMWARDQMAKKAWPHLTSMNPLSTFHYKV